MQPSKLDKWKGLGLDNDNLNLSFQGLNRFLDPKFKIFSRLFPKQ